MQKGALKRRIADYTYRLISWGQNHVPPGLRSVIGCLFMVGGVFGFLPVLGFWMLPLGAAFVALDVPPARRRLDDIRGERGLLAECDRGLDPDVHCL